jgi:hypothetical protein
MSAHEGRPWAVAPTAQGGFLVVCHECASSVGNQALNFRPARPADAALLAEMGMGGPERPVRCVRCRAAVDRLPVGE